MPTKILSFRDIIVITLYKTYEKKKSNIKGFKMFEYKAIKIYSKDLC